MNESIKFDRMNERFSRRLSAIYSYVRQRLSDLLYNWSRLKSSLKLPEQRSTCTMPQINMIPHSSHFKLTLGQPALL